MDLPKKLIISQGGDFGASPPFGAGFIPAVAVAPACYPPWHNPKSPLTTELSPRSVLPPPENAQYEPSIETGGNAARSKYQYRCEAVSLSGAGERTYQSGRSDCPSMRLPACAPRPRPRMGQSAIHWVPATASSRHGQRLEYEQFLSATLLLVCRPLTAYDRRHERANVLTQPRQAEVVVVDFSAPFPLDPPLRLVPRRFWTRWPMQMVSQ